MSDPTFKIVLQGVDAGASSTVDKMVDKLNKAKETTRKWNDERAKLAREDRNSKFRQLSDEEKLAKLKDRQVQIERRLETATRAGNKEREAALRLSAARNKAALGGIDMSAGASMSPAGGRMFAGITGQIGGKAAIGVALAGIAYSMARAVQSSIEFADSIGDTADAMQLTRDEVLKVAQQATAAGVSNKALLGAISRFSAVRGAAQSGDASSIQLLNNYGISGKQINGTESSYSLASKTVASLGSGGMQGQDRAALGKLFGMRPERAIAALRTQVSDSKAGDAFKTLEDQASFQEGAGFLVQKKKAELSASLIKLFDGPINAAKEIFTGILGDDASSSALPVLKRTAGSNPLGKVSKNKIDAAQLAQLGAIGQIASASGLARTGFSNGRNDPEGSGLMRKQIEWTEKIYRESREQKQILREGLL